MAKGGITSILMKLLIILVLFWQISDAKKCRQDSDCVNKAMTKWCLQRAKRLGCTMRGKAYRCNGPSKYKTHKNHNQQEPQ